MYLENDDEILLDVHNASAADLKRHLTVYKLRSKVNISSSKYGIWFQPNGSSAAGESQGTNTILTCPDPRVTDLGHRIIKSLDGNYFATHINAFQFKKLMLLFLQVKWQQQLKTLIRSG